MIKRSALPKGIITKLLGYTKVSQTLAVCCKTQEVITMQDIRLPEFDKNRCINQQKAVVFENAMSSTSSWVQTFFPRLE